MCPPILFIISIFYLLVIFCCGIYFLFKKDTEFKLIGTLFILLGSVMLPLFWVKGMSTCF